MIDFLFTLHVYLRFVILALGILGLLRALVSLGTREARFMRVDEMLSRGFSGALDLQALVGFAIVVLLLGQTGDIQWLHPLIMLPAVIVSHLGGRFRASGDRDRHKAQLAVFAGSLSLIVAGLAVIEQLRLI